jgi:tRNA 2-thiouridine synthesizing protein A/cysteine desulfurase
MIDAEADPPSGDGTKPFQVDARGEACPIPIIMLAKAARNLAPGTELTVLATDVAARYDVPAWARMTGNDFVGESETDGGAIALTVRLRMA